MQTIKYESIFFIGYQILFFSYDDWSGEPFYWGTYHFNLDKTIQTKKYRVVGVRDDYKNPSYLQNERFRIGVAQQKNKAVDLRFSFIQLKIKQKEYEFSFEIELEKAEFKTLSVKNEFLVLNSTQHQKNYTFAFNVYSNQNKAKIFKRIE